VRDFVIATANPDKRREIAEILGPEIRLLARPEWLGGVDETGETLEANARIKAHIVARATGAPAIADDTGLEVDALDGLPGVYSARYSGEGATYSSNVAKLLREMEAVTGNRAARFRTVAVAAWPDGEELLADGEVQGWIATEARGSSGFGYDPVFIPSEGDGRTFAEMTGTDKHRISHRGRAFRALAALINGHVG
jgi:XTP/dITP diphosphohydrolase